MKIDILTIFPEMFPEVLSCSMLGRAKNSGILEFKLHNIRDYSENKHRNTDDYPFGGGNGMVMMAQPIMSCIDSADADHTAYRICLTPRGEPLSTGLAEELAEKDRLLLLAGHYEGIDERVMSVMDREVSIGDYVLTGGELPAMVLIDCVARFVPGVLGTGESATEESFYNGLLEYPQYTRPAEYRGMKTPEVLLNGNHAEIEKWRRMEAIKKTLAVRPELLCDAPLTPHEKLLLQELKPIEK